jgi:hypothetical protein
VETRDAPAFDEHAVAEAEQALGPSYLVQTCFRCEASEQRAVLLPCRTEGKSLWVCTRCLPTLIHG